MPWDRIKDNFRSFTIRDRDAAIICRGVEEFWRLFAADVLPAAAPDTWNYLFVDLRGIDDGMGIYPQHTERSAFRVTWAHLSIHQMGDAYREIVETDDDGLKAASLDQHYANIVVEAAKHVDPANLAGRNEGVLIRFVSYAEDKLSPFHEERIMPCKRVG